MKLHRFGKYRDKKSRMRFIYAKYLTSMPVEKDVILFESFHGKEISDTPLAMARALLDMPCAGDYRLYFSSNDIERDSVTVRELGLPVTIVHIHSDEYARLLATAGLLINNSSFPSYIVRRDEQHYLQTWHGTPWKTLGRSMKGDLATIQNSQHNFIQADYLLFPNDFTRDAIMHDYVLDDIYTGKVITHGYPRNSVFSDSEKAKEIKKFCGDEAVSTLAYMPTWRGQDNKNIDTGAFVEETLDMLASIDKALSSDQKLYVNLHPIIQSSIDLSGFEHIRAFPKNVEKYDFINSVDALITDYSSIFFDYSITGKPIILFTYDYDNYASERGMYFGIEELPFAKAATLEELTEMLRSRSYEKLSYKNSIEYKEKFTKYDTKTAACDLMNYMITGNAGGMRVEDYSFNREKPRRVIDVPKVPNRTDLESIVRDVGENDVVVFHQAGFDEKTGERFKELYDGKFPYVFTTESVPETESEAGSKNKSVREEVKRRNLRRQIGTLNVSESITNSIAGVTLRNIKTSGSRLKLKLKASPGVGNVSRVVLEYRSEIEAIVHDMDIRVSGDGKSSIIDASTDTSLLRHGCIYWDIYAVAGEDKEHENRYSIVLDQSMRKRLRRFYFQCENGEYITFPHISLTHTLAFTHREKTPYDNRATKLREFVASVLALPFGKLSRNRSIWLVFEKFCSAAQDNGYYFFKYCMDQLPESEKKDIYFVIDKNSRDYKEKLEQYGSHVIQFMSFRHLLYALNAKVYVGSDSKRHLYTWRPKPNMVSIRMAAKPIHFLQHGVTALKRTDGLFGAKGSSPMTHITTTSDYEQHIMDEFWGYSPANAPVLGFTRWDVLEDKSTPDDRTILVMPTWRAWLEEKPDEEFIGSDYFRNYMEMLADESLDKCLKDNDVKLIFFIHPKFRDYLDKFTAPSDNIELVQFGSRPLNDIMMKCSMLVTDYSSVCWDVYYMGKPVIFYQFDYDMYMENHGSYLDMEHELFGDRYTELKDVIGAIKRNIENGFEESERAKSMRSKYFKYIDSDNSRRTYEYLKKKGY